MSRRSAALRRGYSPRPKSRRPRTVIVKLNVPRALNRFVPAVVHEPPVRVQQHRTRHSRIPVVAIAGGVVRRKIRIIPRRRKRLHSAYSMFTPSRLTHFSFRHALRTGSKEMNRRRYSEKKSRRGRVSDGHLNSLSRDHGLLAPNQTSVESLSDAALVSRAVFGG